MALPPILDNKKPSAPSVFAPAALMREARRQKNIKEADVPSICLLDPDGDLVRHLRRTGRAKLFEGWPCYHTELDVFSLAGRDVGIVGRAVGASFAVLVAEELFASGCRLLISLTSSGQIVASGPPPYFIIIDRALRDEGTSYHYAPPSEYASACPRLLATAVEALKQGGPRTITGATWTTDAPFRETSEAIQAAADKGILAVEMEAAALYAFSAATDCKVLCLAHVTNTMAQSGRDFEKGEDDGTVDALAVLGAIVGALATDRSPVELFDVAPSEPSQDRLRTKGPPMAIESVLTCPHCSHQSVEIMPTDACQFFYDCKGCGIRLKPRQGDCCVFCSYGSVPCPPVQTGDCCS